LSLRVRGALAAGAPTAATPAPSLVFAVAVAVSFATGASTCVGFPPGFATGASTCVGFPPGFGTPAATSAAGFAALLCDDLSIEANDDSICRRKILGNTIIATNASTAAKTGTT
jgi:hypothetical protein